MGSQQGAAPHKRPFCDRCSKPLRLCLCCRLKSPPIDNPIAVTILQHSLEKDHPLNSTRVAKLGLKNLAVVPVTDVNFHAHFLIRPIDLNPSVSIKSSTFSEAPIGWLPATEYLPEATRRSDLEQSFNLEHNGVAEAKIWSDLEKSFNLEHNGVADATRRSYLVESFDLEHSGVADGEFRNGYAPNHFKKHQQQLKKAKSVKTQSQNLDLDNTGDCGVEAIFDKYRVVCSSTELRVTVERTAKPDISWVLETPIGQALTANGFTVSKLQRKQLRGSEEFCDFKEFDIVIPRGAALLFPSGKTAVGLTEVDFEVKHLVVLDGTWAKAQRMYHENPWLKLLPHLKLEPRKESLYSEVRQQPKAGCLSTVESIICAFKGLGSDVEELDELLDVFESMIGDQRRCKDENFRGKSVS